MESRSELINNFRDLVLRPKFSKENKSVAGWTRA